MSYRRALLFRWSRRDRLAVLAVGLATAFVVGSAVVLLSVGAQTAVVAEEFATGATVEHVAGDAAVDGVRLPIADATTAAGEPVVLVGVPEAVDGLPAPPASGRAIGPSGTVELSGAAGTTRLVASEQGTVFPPWWYVADIDTVERMGVTRALAWTATDAAVPREGSATTGALAFFLAGTRQLLGVLGLVAAGSTVLVGIVVYSVTRMTVLDRRADIRVLRATGATSRQVFGLFGIRAGLVSAVGAAVGYATGVIVPNTLVSVAVAIGQPVGFSPRLTGQAVGLVAGVLAGVVLVGSGAGVVAAWPAARGPPAGEDRADGSGRWPDQLTPTLLSSQAIVPTVGTLTVFVTFVLVVAATGGVVGSLGGGEAVVEPDAIHPVNSQVPEGYADALAASGATASPELLLFGTHDAEPVAVRGADPERFLAFENATVVDGERPTGPDEALVGAGLARTLDVGPGDRIALGGSTRQAASAVEVTGVYRATGLADDYLVVSLPLARHLGNVRPGSVHLIRVRGTTVRAGDSGLVVVDVATPPSVVAGDSLRVDVTVTNVGGERAERTVTVEYDGTTVERTIRLPPDTSRSVSVRVPAGEPGVRTVRVGDRTREIRVLEPTALALGAPGRAPPGATFGLVVRDARVRAVANATVTLGAATVRTDEGGRTRLIAPDEPGSYTIRGRVGNRTTERTLTVATGARRTFDTRVTVEPPVPSVLTRPSVSVRLSNPWGERLTRVVVIEGPGVRGKETVTLAPGGGATIERELDRRQPGEYTVRVLANGTAIAETTYAVDGDDRVGAAIAGSGRLQRGTGVGQAVNALVGNLVLVLGTLVALGGLMTGGSTVAAFAGAVHARRGVVGIRRATGATPGDVVGTILVDALLLGVPAAVASTALALGIVGGLTATDRLVVFGVRLAASVPAVTVGAIAAGAFCLAVASAVIACTALLVAEPATLLGDER